LLKCSGPRSRRKKLILGGQGINLPKVGDFDAGLRLSAASGQRGVGGRGYSGTEELVRWVGIAIEDEDAFVMEGKFGGLPRDLGRVVGLCYPGQRTAHH
jgi:hypothetical protein